MAEAAETALRRELGLLEGWGSYPRRHVEADFLRVLTFEDEIDVRIHAERVGRTSIAWRFEIERAGEVCVAGRMVVVHVDADGRAAPLPEAVRAALIA
jgi:acyl-CoA thioester hydrolase